MNEFAPKAISHAAPPCDVLIQWTEEDLWSLVIETLCTDLPDLH